MKRLVVVFLVGAALGGAGGFALGIFIYPHIFLADIVADEKVDPVLTKTILGRGQFIHANPNDPIHHGRGRVTVYADAVHLESDFAVRREFFQSLAACDTLKRDAFVRCG